MAIGTPVQLANAGGTTSAVTASFTPTANATLFALVSSYQNTTLPGDPQITDSAGLTWTQVHAASYDPGINRRQKTTLFAAQVGGSPAAMTITGSASSTLDTTVEVCEVTGVGADYSNVGSNNNAAGDPSVTLSAPGAASGVIGFVASQGINSYTPTVGFTEILDATITANGNSRRHTVCYDITSPPATLSWTSSNTVAIGIVLELKEAAGGNSYTLTAGASSTTLTGSSATLRAERKLSAGSGSVALTGSDADFIYTPSAAGIYALVSEPGTVTITGSPANFIYTASRKLEVNWPGTNIPRSKFHEMQRAALAQYLRDERERLQRETEEQKPAPRKIKRAVARVIRRIEIDGLLSSEQVQEAAPAIKQAITSNVSLDDILGRLRLSEITFIAEQRLLDEEAAAILLLAA